MNRCRALWVTLEWKCDDYNLSIRWIIPPLGIAALISCGLNKYLKLTTLNSFVCDSFINNLGHDIASSIHIGFPVVLTTNRDSVEKEHVSQDIQNRHSHNNHITAAYESIRPLIVQHKLCSRFYSWAKVSIPHIPTRNHIISCDALPSLLFPLFWLSSSETKHRE